MNTQHSSCCNLSHNLLGLLLYEIGKSPTKPSPVGGFANKNPLKRLVGAVSEYCVFINVKIADLSPDGVVLGEAVQQRGAAQAALPLPPEELDVGVDQELGQQHALLDIHMVNNVIRASQG